MTLMLVAISEASQRPIRKSSRLELVTSLFPNITDFDGYGPMDKRVQLADQNKFYFDRIYKN